MSDVSPPTKKEPALRALLDRIVPAFQPQAVYLFGSRAEGRAGGESDWDLLVVVPDDTPPEQLTVVAGYAAIRGSGIAADVIPTRQSRFEALKRQVGSLSYVAWHRGRLVYRV
ncbi:MAG TPA: nucleotidyltransferase domain-containing protein [Alphaproteobacteria bacterium]|nr:nucleotidyltransferase domain-containing protein [Alphaproteobacteria bacterium]